MICFEKECKKYFNLALKLMIIYKRDMLKACLPLILICCFFAGCSKINSFLGLSDDNVVEQKIEEIIENETGFIIDLTPEIE